MSDFERRAVKSRVQQKVGFSSILAIVGDDNIPVNVFDTTIPGNVWVRLQYANGYGKPISVRGPIGTSVQLKPGTPVELIYTPDKRLQVKGYDPVGGTIAGTALLAVNAPQQESGGFIGQQSLITALVTPQKVPDLTVVVKSWIVIIDWIYYEFPGDGSVDLSSLVPASGSNRYAVIFVQDNFVTVSVQASTARSIADLALNSADIQECLDAEPTTSTPLASIRLYGDQTQITTDDIKQDLRQVINTAPGSGSTPGAVLDSILTDGNGDVLTDGNGNVLYD